MKNFFKKHWALIGFVLAFTLDHQFQIIENFVNDPFWSNIIRGIGAIVLAKYWSTENVTVINEINNMEARIGGGGIKNPSKGG
jgi:hypothetical protein